MSKYRISLAGKIYEIEVQKIDETADTAENRLSSYVSMSNRTDTVNPNVQIIDPLISKQTVNENNVVHSPLPGTIIKIFVRNGDKVKKGQAILILEAMKMENEITAPIDGIVSGLDVVENLTVQGGKKLFEIVE